MATLLLFAQAREAAGTKSAVIEGGTVAEVLDNAVARYGPALERVLPHCRFWCNGEPVTLNDAVGAGDELAVLPPVSGG